MNPKKIKKIKHLLKYKDVNISGKCCYFLKKKPLKEWQIKSGKKVAIMGVGAQESRMRRTVWVRKGCVYETKDQVVCNPIIFFKQDDIKEYAKKHRIRFAEIYYKGLKRNGCYCCGFGSHMKDENNFVILKRLNPQLYENVMKKWGYEKICKQCDIGVPAV